jgi:hypothetical protein
MKSGRMDGVRGPEFSRHNRVASWQRGLQGSCLAAEVTGVQRKFPAIRVSTTFECVFRDIEEYDNFGT